jgi:hypothetical protein
MIMALCVVTVVAAGQRWPLQYLILIALFSVVISHGKLPGRAIALAGLIGLFLGGLLSALQARGGVGASTGIWGLLESGIANVLQRMFLGYVETPIASYYLSDVRLVDQGGATYWQSLAAYLPGLGESYAVTFYSIVYRSQTGFTAPPDFATELFINWGMLGVVIGGFIWGAFLASADDFVSDRKWGFESMAMLAMCVLNAAVVATSGVMTSLRVVFIIVPVLAAIRLFGGRPMNREGEPMQQGSVQSESATSLV